MSNAILVLQYPDRREGRTVALAVLEDARLSLMDRDGDDLLRVHDQLELTRLEKLLICWLLRLRSCRGWEKSRTVHPRRRESTYAVFASGGPLSGATELHGTR